MVWEGKNIKVGGIGDLYRYLFYSAFTSFCLVECCLYLGLLYLGQEYASAVPVGIEGYDTPEMVGAFLGMRAL